MGVLYLDKTVLEYLLGFRQLGTADRFSYDDTVTLFLFDPANTSKPAFISNSFKSSQPGKREP